MKPYYYCQGAGGLGSSRGLVDRIRSLALRSLQRLSALPARGHILYLWSTWLQRPLPMSALLCSQSPSVRTPLTAVTHSTSDNNVWDFSSHRPTLQFFDTNWESYLSIQFQHYLPRVSRPHTGLRVQFHNTALTADTSHKDWVPRLPTLLSNLATKLGVPTTLTFRFDNLLD